MSQTVVAEEIRLALAQSLPVVERHREAIISGMQDRLVAMETNDEAFGQGDVTALVLVRLLIDGAADLAAFGGVHDLSQAADEHRRLDIDGRHYSRFGAALERIMRDALGPRLSPAMIAAWVDAFWVVVRELTVEDTLAERAG